MGGKRLNIWNNSSQEIGPLAIKFSHPQETGNKNEVIPMTPLVYFFESFQVMVQGGETQTETGGLPDWGIGRVQENQGD